MQELFCKMKSENIFSTFKFSTLAQIRWLERVVVVVPDQVARPESFVSDQSAVDLRLWNSVVDSRLARGAAASEASSSL